MKNKRIAIRKRPNESISILDANTEYTLGQLANISMGGLMLVGSISTAPGSLFQLKMPLSTPIHGIDTIEFGAESLWCLRAKETSSYWTGLQIIDISDSASDSIATLISGWQ